MSVLVVRGLSADDIEPVTGMEAKHLFNELLNVADVALGWDDGKLEDFKKKNIEYRSFTMKPKAFWKYLNKHFSPDVMLTLVRDIVRLLPEREQRQGLLDLQNKLFDKWGEVESRETDQMWKEDQAMREMLEARKNVRVYKAGDKVTAQFKRLNGTRYQGLVTKVYSKERAEFLDLDLEDNQEKLEVTYNRLDKKANERIKTLKMGIKAKQEEITPLMRNRDDATKIQMATIEPQVEQWSKELENCNDEVHMTSEKMLDIEADIEKKSGKLEEYKQECQDTDMSEMEDKAREKEEKEMKKKLKKLTAGVKKKQKELAKKADAKAELEEKAKTLEVELEQKEQQLESLKTNFSAPYGRQLELEKEVAEKRALMISKGQLGLRLVVDRMHMLEKAQVEMEMELKTTREKLQQAHQKLEHDAEVEHAYDVAEITMCIPLDIEVPELSPEERVELGMEEGEERPVEYDLEWFTSGAVHDEILTQEYDGVLEGGVATQQLVPLGGMWAHLNTALHGDDKEANGLREYLVTKPMEARIPGQHGDTALHLAATMVNIPVVELLLTKGVNGDAAGRDGDTPLHCAVRGPPAPKGKKKKKKKKKKGKDKAKEPEAVAVIEAPPEKPSKAELVAMLLSGSSGVGGASPNAKNVSHVTPLMLAAAAVPVAGMDVSELQEKLVPFEEELNKILQKKPKKRKKEEVARVEELQPEVDRMQAELAVEMAKTKEDDENCEVVTNLLMYEADREAVDVNGNTALMYACKSNNLKMFKLLCSKGCKMGCTNGNGEGLIHIAAQYNSAKIIRHILLPNEEAEKAEKKRLEAEEAARLAAEEQARLAAEEEERMKSGKKAKKAKKTKKKKQKGEEEEAQAPPPPPPPDPPPVLTAEQAVAREVRTKYGETALYIAASNGAVDSVQLLLELKAELEAENDGKFSPLMRASGRAHVPVVKLLVHAGANIDAMTPFEAFTPQIWAAKSRNPQNEKLIDKTVKFLEKARKDKKKQKLEYQKKVKAELKAKMELYAPKPKEDDGDDDGKGKKGKKGKGKKGGKKKKK
jgi:ankyrin repeat protein